MDTRIILGIETSCDETAAAVLKKEGSKIQILSNIVASSAQIQAKYGGIIPEQAAREQIKSIIPVITEAMEKADVVPDKLDSLAITYGPGLIGSLLVGVETAKTLSQTWQKPLIPVNHLIGHFYANWISTDDGKQLPEFPCIGLLVSGGHSDLIYMKGHGNYEYIGGTRDDAAGECFDKSARLLGLPYPGGPQISKLGEQGNCNAFKLPRPMIDSNDFDFSYSGLKTAVANLISSQEQLKINRMPDLCASIEQAIIEPLVKKTIKAAEKYGCTRIIAAGGVSANKRLAVLLREAAEGKTIEVILPPSYLCTDNASMIASAAFFIEYTGDAKSIQANPNLSLQ